jgi:hypothetical protein
MDKMKSLDYLSKAELQPSINRLMGLFNSLAGGQPLDEAKTRAIVAILMDIDDMCDEAYEVMEEAEDKMEDETESSIMIPMPRML